MSFHPEAPATASSSSSSSQSLSSANHPLSPNLSDTYPRARARSSASARSGGSVLSRTGAAAGGRNVGGGTGSSPLVGVDSARTSSGGYFDRSSIDPLPASTSSTLSPGWIRPTTTSRSRKGTTAGRVDEESISGLLGMAPLPGDLAGITEKHRIPRSLWILDDSERRLLEDVIAEGDLTRRGSNSNSSSQHHLPLFDNSPNNKSTPEITTTTTPDNDDDQDQLDLDPTTPILSARYNLLPVTTPASAVAGGSPTTPRPALRGMRKSTGALTINLSNFQESQGSGQGARRSSASSNTGESSTSTSAPLFPPSPPPHSTSIPSSSSYSYTETGGESSITMKRSTSSSSSSFSRLVNHFPPGLGSGSGLLEGIPSYPANHNHNHNDEEYRLLRGLIRKLILSCLELEDENERLRGELELGGGGGGGEAVGTAGGLGVGGKSGGESGGAEEGIGAQAVGLGVAVTEVNLGRSRGRVAEADRLSVHDSLTEALSSSLPNAPSETASIRRTSITSLMPDLDADSTIKPKSSQKSPARPALTLVNSSSEDSVSLLNAGSSKGGKLVKAQGGKTKDGGEGLVPGPSAPSSSATTPANGTKGKQTADPPARKLNNRSSWTSSLWGWGSVMVPAAGGSTSEATVAGDKGKTKGHVKGKASYGKTASVKTGREGSIFSGSSELGEALPEEEDEDEDAWRKGDGGSSPGFRAIFLATRILTPDPNSVLNTELSSTSLVAALAHALVSQAREEGIIARSPPTRSRRTSISAKSLLDTPAKPAPAIGLGEQALNLGVSISNVFSTAKGKAAALSPSSEAKKSLLRTLSVRDTSVDSAKMRLSSPDPAGHSTPSTSTPLANSSSADQIPSTTVELNSITARSERPPTMLPRKKALEEYFEKNDPKGRMATQFGDADLSGYTDRYGFVYDIKYVRQLLEASKRPALLPADDWAELKRKIVRDPDSPQLDKSSHTSRRASDAASSMAGLTPMMSTPTSPAPTTDSGSASFYSSNDEDMTVNGGSTASTLNKPPRPRSASIGKHSLNPSPSKPLISHQTLVVSASGSVNLKPTVTAGPLRSNSGTIKLKRSKIFDKQPMLAGSKPVESLLGQLTEAFDKREEEKTLLWNDFLAKHRKKVAEAQALASSTSHNTSMTSSMDPSVNPTTLLSLHLLPPKVSQEERKSMEKLVRKVGIPIEIRGRIWAELSGANEVEVPGEFEEMLKGFEVAKGKSPKEWGEVLEDIEKDVGRTFANNTYFGGDGVGCQKLRKVLTAYAYHDPSVGYCQGMNLLTATLLLCYPSPSTTFFVLSQLLSDLLPADFYSPSLLGSRVEQKVLEEYVVEVLPDVARKFKELMEDGAGKDDRQGLGLGLLEGWSFAGLMGMFCVCLPVETLFRVWDVFFVEGNSILIRTTLALLSLGRKGILACESAGDVFEFLNNLGGKFRGGESGTKLVEVSNDMKSWVKVEELERRRSRWRGVLGADSTR